MNTVSELFGHHVFTKNNTKSWFILFLIILALNYLGLAYQLSLGAGYPIIIS